MKRRATNEQFVLRLAPIPKSSPTPTADCALANEAQKGLIGGNTEAQNERTPSLSTRGP